MNDGSTLRSEAIQRSLEDYRASRNNRTENIEYRGDNRSVEVIRVNPSILLLNHNNHRVKAQLLDHPKRALVEQTPTSAEAQAVIANLLAGTDEFKALKTELKEFGQMQPGLVTREGLVMNGNTRVVALRELGADGVLVGVLPEDVTSADLLTLEVSLQMRKQTHQDYTYTNELLLLDELSRLYTAAEIAKKMHWTKKINQRLEQAARILTLIQEIRSLHTEGTFPYSYFDTKKEHLVNLDDAYQSALQVNFEEAEALKWTRIWAMLHGVSKDQVRAIDADFIEHELTKRLDIATSDEVIKSRKSNDDLDEIFGSGSDSPDVKAMTKDLINKMLDTDGSVVKEVDATFDQVGRQIKLATDDLIKQQRQSAILAEPSEILREARISIANIEAKFESLSSSPGFDHAKFSYELKRASKALDSLQAKFLTMN